VLLKIDKYQRNKKKQTAPLFYKHLNKNIEVPKKMDKYHRHKKKKMLLSPIEISIKI
jgi:hypothetical protein